MNRVIQQQAAARADELLSVSLEHPFGPDWDVYKVRGRVFMLQSEVTGEPLVILKAAPEDRALVRAGHEHISPGYHMNKKHWITLHPGGDLDRQFVEDLVTESYLLVVERSLPRSQRPVDPRTFGRPGRH